KSPMRRLTPPRAAAAVMSALADGRTPPITFGLPSASGVISSNAGGSADRNRSRDAGASTTNDDGDTADDNRHSRSAGRVDSHSRGSTDAGDTRRRRDPTPGQAAPSRQVRRQWPTRGWFYACGDPSLGSRRSNLGSYFFASGAAGLAATQAPLPS